MLFSGTWLLSAATDRPSVASVQEWGCLALASPGAFAYMAFQYCPMCLESYRADEAAGSGCGNVLADYSLLVLNV